MGSINTFLIIFICLFLMAETKKSRQHNRNKQAIHQTNNPVHQMVQSFKASNVNQFNHAVHGLQRDIIKNKPDHQQQHGAAVYRPPPSCPCKNRRPQPSIGSSSSESRPRKRKCFKIVPKSSSSSSHHSVEQHQPMNNYGGPPSYPSPSMNYGQKSNSYEKQQQPYFQHEKSKSYGHPPSVSAYPKSSSSSSGSHERSFKNYPIKPKSSSSSSHKSSSSHHSKSKSSIKSKSSSSSHESSEGCEEEESSSDSCSCEAVECGKCHIKSLFKSCAACLGLIVPQIVEFKSIPRGCPAFRAYCPPTTQYYFVSPNGTITIATITTPIIIECGIDNQWYQWYGTAPSTAIVIIPISTSTTTTAVTTTGVTTTTAATTTTTSIVTPAPFTSCGNMCTTLASQGAAIGNASVGTGTNTSMGAGTISNTVTNLAGTCAYGTVTCSVTSVNETPELTYSQIISTGTLMITQQVSVTDPPSTTISLQLQCNNPTGTYYLDVNNMFVAVDVTKFICSQSP